ncbi:MAG: imidazole glycerol phosphate synthase subunit HisH [Armatimonadota bacterium]|nr:imidazole glycerol phosphate synthase subunit HisH [Armatimonadota bacterium]MDW8026603.1 imidazole glycerol phosphate synthase subunit HisH [Armatimonadota bacterium]
MNAFEVTVIDYGVGNLMSIVKAFEALGCKVNLTDNQNEIAHAKCLVLPGVGAFGAGMLKLRNRGLVEVIKEAVMMGTPTLGVCLGMQLMMSWGEEHGTHEGLGLVSGRVVQLPKLTKLKIPHMGWNKLSIRERYPLFIGLPNCPMVYFVHSFHVIVDDPSLVTATAWHGIEFVSAIWRKNLCGTQFHPEKSGRIGLAILRNFIEFAMASAK